MGMKTIRQSYVLFACPVLDTTSYEVATIYAIMGCIELDPLDCGICVVLDVPLTELSSVAIILVLQCLEDWGGMGYLRRA